MEQPQIHKSHKPAKAGAKVNKKRAKVERHNPRAFTFSGGHVAHRQKVQYRAEVAQKRETVEKIDKDPLLSKPPLTVVCQGPRGSGKSLVIRCLVKHYTGQSIRGDVQGCITLLSSKTRRLTFIESESRDDQGVPSSLASLIDLAKICDIMLLLIDARKGLELETLEFLDIVKNHGFPGRVIGVLTHMDEIAPSLQKKRRREIKRRMEQNVTAFKLFYFTGLKGNRYHKRETLNLAKFISVQRCTPLNWRNQHPYVLALNIEKDSETHQKNSLSFVGYVRGTRMNAAQTFHIPGCGDFKAAKIISCVDPCPFPESSSKSAMSKDSNKQLRRLKNTDKHLYAPSCDVGSLAFEGSSMFIRLAGDRQTFTPTSNLEDKSAAAAVEDGETTASEIRNKRRSSSASSSSGWSSDEQNDGLISSEDESPEGGISIRPEERITDAVRLVRTLQASDNALEEQVSRLELGVFDGDEAEEVNEEVVEDLALSDTDSDESDLDMTRVEWGHDHVDDALKTLESELPEAEEEHHDADELEAIVYGIQPGREPTDPSKWSRWMKNGREQSESLFAEETTDCPTIDLDAFDCSKLCDELRLEPLASIDWDGEEPSEEDAADTDEIIVKRNPDLASIFPHQMFAQLKRLCFITGGWEEGMTKTEKEALELPDTLEDYDMLRRQEKIKAAKQAKASKLTDETLMDEMGAEDEFGVGQFVRITIEGLPEEWIKTVTAPGQGKCVLLGGVLPGENALTYVKCKVKKHRWFKSLLKTGEPLLFSAGWRRFQSLPYFCMEDRNSVRIRYLKYTPEHMHCQMYYYGHSIPPGAGLVAFKHLSERLAEYRVSLSGSVLETDPSPRVMKKLKFIGEPVRILKNTAFVSKMFTSDLEVSRCVGVPIQTQSGIRGVVKKAHGTGGDFRATFEAKIQKNDTIIMKAWYRVAMEAFCNPFVDATDVYGQGWDRLKTLNEIRRELALPIDKGTPFRQKETPREVKTPRVKIPKAILSKLPYASLPKADEDKLDLKSAEETVVVKPSAFDLYAQNLIAQATLNKERVLQKQSASYEARTARRKKAEEAKQQGLELKSREEKKAKFRKQGLKEQNARKRLRLEE